MGKAHRRLVETPPARVAAHHSMFPSANLDWGPIEVRDVEGNVVPSGPRERMPTEAAVYCTVIMAWSGRLSALGPTMICTGPLSTTHPGGLAFVSQYFRS